MSHPFHLHALNPRRVLLGIAVLAAAVAVGLVVRSAVRLFAPGPEQPDVTIRLYTLEESNERFDAAAYGGDPGEAKLATRLHVTGKQRGAGGDIVVNSGNLPVTRTEVLILVQGHITRSVDLAIPRSGDIVYVYRRDRWESLTNEKIPDDTLRIEIRPFGNGIIGYTLTLLGVEGKQYSGERYSVKIEGFGT